MKRFLTLFILNLLPLTFMAAALQPLEPFQWKHRIILYSIDAKQVPKLETLLEQEAAAIKDRQLIFIHLNPSPASNLPFHADLSESERRKLRDALEPVERTELILVGKDGGVKKRVHRLELSALFDAIDQMPMRRAEMRRSSE